MLTRNSGFSLIELLVVVVVVGLLFVFLVAAIDPLTVINRVRNVTVRAGIEKVVLSTEAFKSSYNWLPNEHDFLAGLKADTLELDTSCTLTLEADFECIFLPSLGMLPSTCDTTSWRSDRLGTNQCYMRYYSDPLLAPETYRIYAKSWNTNGEFFVYDSGNGGAYYFCPPKVSDLYSLEICRKI